MTVPSVPIGEPAIDRRALAVAGAVFFMWGFLTSLNDVLVPHLKAVFALNYARVMLVQFTFFGAYFVMSLPSGVIVSRFGDKISMVAGLLVSAAGAFLFYPAAAIPSFGVFLGGFFTLASGITLLQVAANPYVARLGPERTAASRLNLAQALNSLGTTLAPKIGGWLILSTSVLSPVAVARLSSADQIAYLRGQAELVQTPYLVLALALAVLAAAISLCHLPSVVVAARKEDDTRSLGDALDHRNLRLGVVAIFVYVGAEVAIGSFLINYISQPDIGGLTERSAATFVALYWGGAMVGRFVGAGLLRRVNPRRLLAISASMAALLVATSMTTSGTVAVGTIVAVGLFNSIMFPTIFVLSVEGLGALTGQASSLLIMAIVGGAVVPLLQGILADAAGIQRAFVLPVVCYAYVVFYGLRGARAEA